MHITKSKTALAVKAARLRQSMSRKQAAHLCGITPRAFEQLENGRCNAREARLRHLTAKLGLSWEEFLDIQNDPQKHLAQAVTNKPLEKTLARKPRRNEYKIITKEVRVIRSLRMQKGLSQSEASRLCAYGPQGFSFLEAGRVELTPKKITHILKCFGYTLKDFERLMQAPLLRDEIIEEIMSALPKVSDLALTAIQQIIQELAKKGE